MSDTYVSREKRCEAKRWGGVSDPLRYVSQLVEIAEAIVTWVNSHGGEARYDKRWELVSKGAHSDDDGYNWVWVIVLTTSIGPQYLYPGWYAVMGEKWFDTWEYDEIDFARKVREFLPVDPQTFEAEWESKR